MADRQLGLALDFSASSNYALQWSLDNILRDGDTLILLMVVKQTDSENLWSDNGSPLIPFEEMKDSVMKRYGVTNVSKEVYDILSKFVQTSKVKIQGKVLYGDAREKLVQAIVELPLDSLVMGSRGLGGLKKVFLGSVSNYVVNNAPCPVTVVKMPESPIA